MGSASETLFPHRQRFGSGPIDDREVILISSNVQICIQEVL